MAGAINAATKGGAQWSVQAKVRVGFASALLILLAVGLLSYRASLRFVKTTYWINHADEVLNALEKTRADLRNAEAAERSYIITADAASLAEYGESAAGVAHDLKLISALTAGDARQQERAARLALFSQEQLAHFKATIAIRQRDGFEAARQQLSQQSRALEGAITQAAAQIETTERESLLLRSSDSSTWAKEALLTVAGLTALAFALVAIAYLMIAHDMEERRITARALHESEARARALIESAPYGVYTFTPAENRFLDANPALVRMLGYQTREEVLALDLTHEVYRDPQQRRDLLSHIKTLNGLQEFHVETEWRRRDGRPITVHLSGRSMQQNSGVMRSSTEHQQSRPLFAVMAEDVTARKQAEMQLQAALKMQSDFVSFVSHQLRTPLTGIRWMLELAAQEAGVPESAMEHLSDARASAERLIGLVNDLLDLARLESGKLTVANTATHLGEITRSVLADISPVIVERGHTVYVCGPEDIPTIASDPQLLRQVILNLISNAVKYTPRGGEILIEMMREDDEICWTIEDTGIGIPQAAQDRLFEKFYRAENAVQVETEGTGLGLYLVRLIVERCGGQIWFNSEEDRGSMFRFTLPVTTVREAPSSASAPCAVSAGESRTLQSAAAAAVARAVSGQVHGAASAVAAVMKTENGGRR